MLTWMVNRKRQLDLVNVVHTPSVNPIEYQLTRTRANKGGACSAQMAIRRHKQAQTTVACIIGSGLALACLGALFVFLGTVYRAKSTPWFVAGGTCISVGLLVLLLSVETILKCRRRASLDRKLERTRKDSGPVRLVPRISTMATASTCGDIQTQSDPGNSAGPESPIHTASNPCPLQQRNMPYSAAPAHNINISISNIRALHTLSIKRSHSSPSSVRLNNHEAVV